MQHLMHTGKDGAQLALALGYLKEKEMRTDRAKRMKQASIQEKALQALHVKVEEAPVESIFEQPNIQDAEILMRITPEQAQRSEEALTGTLKKLSSQDEPTTKKQSSPPQAKKETEDVQRRAGASSQHARGKGGRAHQ